MVPDLRPITAKPVTILLAEDNPGDVRLVQEALREAKVINRLTVASDGVEVLEALRCQGKFAHLPRPDILLLDLNLPRKDGRAVLAEVKADPQLMRLPVVIMTSSAAEEDIVRAYDLHANAYVTKPLEFDRFIEVVHAIESFWLQAVTLPRSP